MRPSSARAALRTSGTSPDIDPRTLREPPAAPYDRSASASPPLPSRPRCSSASTRSSAIVVALRAAGRQAGEAVVIEGAAGIGKSRLLEEARIAGLGPRLRVLSARATELEQGFPFGVVRQLFERPLLEADSAERERWLSGAASLAADVLIGAPPSASERTGAGSSRERSRLCVAARPLLAGLESLRRFAARARRRRPAVVRRAIGANASRSSRAGSRGSRSRSSSRPGRSIPR